MKKILLSILMLGVLLASFGVVSAATLDLCSKNSTWQCATGPTATLDYNETGIDFEYTLTTDQTFGEDYVLIYYADQPDRFVDWSGAPAHELGILSEGQISLTGSVDVESLPFVEDWNTNPNPDYCDFSNGFDNYTNCFGAKIWLIPASDYNGVGKVLSSWRPELYLFETDLISYIEDDESPIINSISINHEHPKTTDNVVICADVEDNTEVDFVSIFCEIDGTTSGSNLNADLSENGYCMEISAGSLGEKEDKDVLVCTIETEDIFGNNNITGPVTLATYDGEKPKVEFDCVQTSGNESLTTICTSTSTDTVTTNQADLVYAWDFGNGDTATTKVASVTYMSDKLYTVSLDVTDLSGQSDDLIKTDYITVNDVSPVPDFTYTSPVKEGVAVTFTNTSTSHDDIISSTWSVDGITISGPTHTFPDNGTYDVSLEVCDAEDCVVNTKPINVDNVAPVVTINGETKCDENDSITLSVSVTDVVADTMSYLWSHDSSTSNTATYNCENGYTTPSVTIEVSDEDGGVTSVIYNITVNNVPPVANANGPYNAAVDVKVCFDASATDVWDSSFNYRWDLDYDVSFNNDATGDYACKTYTSTGVYDIALIATDDFNDSQIEITTVTVYDWGIQLDEGWNLISIPVVPENTAINSVFAGIIDSISYEGENAATILQYDAVENAWFKSRPNAEGDAFEWNLETSELTNIVPGYGYWIKMNEDTILYGNEVEFAPQSQPTPFVKVASQTWNLVGKYEINSTPIIQQLAFESLEGQFIMDSLRGYNKDTESLAYRKALETGQGYWIRTTNFDDGDEFLIYEPITYIDY